MSVYAVTPEIYAAWRYLETDDDDLYEREQVEMLREEEELGFLLAGTRFKFSATKVFLPDIRALRLQTSKGPLASQNSNNTSSSCSSSNASHNGPWLVN
jgi:hypothetical protein